MTIPPQPLRRPRTPILTILALAYINYDLYRVATNSHPYFTPRLQEAGLIGPQTQSRQNFRTQISDGNIGSRLREVGDTEQGEDGWRDLNGIPIPSIGLLMKPFRRDN